MVSVNSETIRAKYEDKVLKPYQDLHLDEGEVVQIKIQRNLIDKFHGKMAIDKKITDEIIGMEIWD
jgi:predicted DNA-binding antitoxin AbrB/MazE fold protein